MLSQARLLASFAIIKNNLLLTEYAWNLNTLRNSPIKVYCMYRTFLFTKKPCVHFITVMSRCKVDQDSSLSYEHTRCAHVPKLLEWFLLHMIKDWKYYSSSSFMLIQYEPCRCTFNKNYSLYLNICFTRSNTLKMWGRLKYFWNRVVESQQSQYTLLRKKFSTHASWVYLLCKINQWKHRLNEFQLKYLALY